MINNYLYTIGKYLSPSQREDVLKEVEVHLYDYLEEHFGEKEYSDRELEQAMKSMGHPRTVAEAYSNGPRSLIGPAYIDTYWLVIKISLIGTAIGLTVANLFSGTDARDSIQFFLQLLAQIWQSGISIVGVVTLIFVAINYYNPQHYTVQDNDWSVGMLDTPPKPNNKIEPIEIIIETFFICLGLVIINRLTGGTPLHENTIPIINLEYFAPYIIWINIVLVASLLVNIYLLIKRQWQTGSRLLAMVLDAASVVIFAMLVFTPEVWDFNDLQEKIGLQNTWLESSLLIALVVVVCVVLYEAYGHVKAILSKR